MNFSRSSVSAWVCVAALATLVGCSSDNEPSSATSATPTITANSSPSPSTAPDISIQERPGYDELEHWATTEQLPGMKQMAQNYGLPAIYVPQASFVESGYVGVSRFEKYCIVALSSVSADVDAGRLSVAVLSRFNRFLNAAQVNLSAPEIKSALESWKAVCRGEAPVPNS